MTGLVKKNFSLSTTELSKPKGMLAIMAIVLLRGHSSVTSELYRGGGAENNKNRVFVRDRDFISWSLNDEIRPRLVFL